MKNIKLNKKVMFIVSIFVLLSIMLGVKLLGYDKGLYLKTSNNQVTQNASKGNDVTNNTKELVNCLDPSYKNQIVEETNVKGSNEPSEKNKSDKVSSESKKSKLQTTNAKDSKTESCNKTDLEKQLDKTPIIYSEDYQVYIPIYTASPKDSSEQHTDLDKGAITYNSFGTPGKGNYDVFGHNAFEEGQYFTSFARHLKKGDKVYLLAKDGKGYKKFEYTIKYKYEVDKDDVSSVYYESDKPIITIGTCKVPYKTENRIIWQGDLTNTTNI